MSSGRPHEPGAPLTRRSCSPRRTATTARQPVRARHADRHRAARSRPRSASSRAAPRSRSPAGWRPSPRSSRAGRRDRRRRPGRRVLRSGARSSASSSSLGRMAVRRVDIADTAAVLAGPRRRRPAVARDGHEPAAGGARPARAHRGRARGRSARRGGCDLLDAADRSPARPRRGHRHALGDQVPGRALRRAHGRAGHPLGRARPGAGRRRTIDRGGPRRARVVPGAARAAHARRTDGAGAGQRGELAPRLAGHPAVRAGALPRAAVRSRARGRDAGSTPGTAR